MAVQQPHGRQTFPPPSMPPLTRQPTLESVLSWWSDSNPPRATINLHAAAKPLMKLMYHRQALGFVKRNNGVPLSAETLEIYWSYVSWKYVSTLTKNTILEELETRAASEEDAHMLIYSNTVDKIVQLRRPSSVDMGWQVRHRSAAILRNLASHSNSTSAAVIEPLVALLRDSNVNNVKLGFDLLSGVTFSLDCAEGFVAANALHDLLEGLGSPSPDVRQETCWLMETLLKHQSTAAAVISLNPCKALLALSRQVAADNLEAWCASDVLVAIATWPDGAEAAVAAHVLDHVVKWCASDFWMRRSACRLMENLARHKSTAGAVMDLEPCERLVTIIQFRFRSDPDNYLTLYALEALSSIAHWPDGAVAVVAANVLYHLTKGLVSQQSGVRRAACRLVVPLVQHESTAQAVARTVPRERLVALLRDKDEDVRESADKALQALDNYLASTQAPTDEPGKPYVL
ncbi:armadillo-type protein [Mycena latifolia]|nr:armadillo-type protein [Mycena latifolia]